jgi:hypothetical protein
MDFYFILLCLVHYIIWIFVLLAFLNKKTAEINLYYVIPFIYIIHILPFHIILEAKKSIYGSEYGSYSSDMDYVTILPTLFFNIKDNLFKNSFFNPLSPQGMLVFGAITSAYTLKSYCNLS